MFASALNSELRCQSVYPNCRMMPRSPRLSGLEQVRATTLNVFRNCSPQSTVTPVILLDERVETVTDEIETLEKSDDSCRRVMTVPGIGPLISSAMVAAIGSGTAFAKGRDYSAWLGLVPRQMSPGTELSSAASPSVATVTCTCSSSKQPGSFCCGRRTGRSTVSAPGSFVPFNAYILTFWLRPSPTSWHGSPGPC